MISDTNPLFLLGSETWLHANVTDNEIEIPGYCLVRRDRPDSAHGGVLIYYKKEVPVLKTLSFSSCEAVGILTRLGGVETHVISVYRPPNSHDDYLCELGNYLATTPSNSTILLGGDFNFSNLAWANGKCTQQAPSTAASRAFLDIINCNFLSQAVSAPSRGLAFLDLLLTNKFELVEGCTVLPPFSDHCPCVVSLRISVRSACNTSRYVHDYSRADVRGLQAYMSNSQREFEEISWQSEPRVRINAMWEFFRRTLVEGQSRFVPQRRATQSSGKPWFSPGLRRLLNRKQRLYKKAKKSTQGSNAWLRYEQIEREVNQKMALAKKHFLAIILPNLLISNPAKFWKQINLSSSVTSSADFGCSPTELADKFADYFSRVFDHTAVDDGNGAAQPSLSFEPRMADVTFHYEGLKRRILALPQNSAPGPDEVSSALMRCCPHECSTILLRIFVESYQCGCLPDDWKSANVIPIHKGNRTPRSEISNYRPISLTSICCKLMEHILTSEMYAYLDSKSFFVDAQHGFRRRYNCETQLLEFVHSLASSYDASQQSDVIFLDFAKAFDKVCHSILISKVFQAGIAPKVCTWISDFLRTRKMQVYTEGVLSRPVSVLSGVPQGSVLGPLLFLIYINDLIEVLPDSVKARLYADDCALERIVNCLNDTTVLQTALNCVLEWCEQNRMTLNVSKCKVMTVASTRSPILIDYNVLGVPLERVNEYKYLGVTISKDLKWTSHTSNIVSSANAKLGFIRRHFSKTSVTIKKLLYETLVRSKMEYASAVWDPYQAYLARNLEGVQNRAIRFICNNYEYQNSSISALREGLAMDTLEDRRSASSTKLFTKIYCNELGINMNSYARKKHEIRTRTQHPHSLEPIRARKDVFKFSFFPRMVVKWNALGPDFHLPGPEATPT
jgi:ribonucleases P/MRP protein subunit RPP40